MAYHIEWLQPDRVLSTSLYNDVRAPQIFDITVELLNRTHASPLVVHHLIDTRYITQYPKRLSEVMKWIPDRFEAGQGWVLIIVANPIIKHITTAILHMSDAHFRFVHTPADAIGLLSHLDPTLADLPDSIHYAAQLTMRV